MPSSLFGCKMRSARGKRSDSRADIAYAKLRGAIEKGALAPGQRLLEAELAVTLKMSRTPIREALGRLQSDRLVAFEPRRGLVVCALDGQKISELYVMREILEAEGARLAAQHASTEQIENLNELLKEQGGLSNNRRALVEHDRRFHYAVNLSASNRYLIKALDSLGSALLLLNQYVVKSEDGPQKAMLEHRAIVDAVASKDPGKAEKAARAHTQAEFKNQLKNMLEENEF